MSLGALVLIFLVVMFLILGGRKKKETQSEDVIEIRGMIIGYEKSRGMVSAKTPFSRYMPIYRVIVNGEEIVFRDTYGIRTRNNTRIGEYDILYYNKNTKKIFSKSSVDSYFVAPMLVVGIILLAMFLPLIKILIQLLILKL